MILADIGEVGVHKEGGDKVVFRPSFYAVSKLGSPSEIVQLFYRVMSAETEAQAFEDSVHVLWCCTEQDATELTGFWGSEDDRVLWVPGMMGAAEVVILARHLLTHGVTGDIKKRRKKKEKAEYMSEFDAASFASLAMAHLNLPEREAWNMTMTGFVAAMTAKFPPSEKERELESMLDNYDETMERARKMRAARIAKEALKNG